MKDTPTTQLPDGSGFFTTTILSREEALALPLKDRPLNYRISGNLYHAVYESIGTASMCWNPRPENETFNSEEASNVAVKLCLTIADEIDQIISERDEAREMAEKLREQVEWTECAPWVFSWEGAEVE